jgi:hypothetical protein
VLIQPSKIVTSYTLPDLPKPEHKVLHRPERALKARNWKVANVLIHVGVDSGMPYMYIGRSVCPRHTRCLALSLTGGGHSN